MKLTKNESNPLPYTLETLTDKIEGYYASDDKDYKNIISLLSPSVRTLELFDNLLGVQDHMEVNFRGNKDQSNKVMDWVKPHENYEKTNAIWLKIKISERENFVGTVWIYFILPILNAVGIHEAQMNSDNDSLIFVDKKLCSLFGKIHQMMTKYEQEKSYDKEIWLKPN